MDTRLVQAIVRLDLLLWPHLALAMSLGLPDLWWDGGCFLDLYPVKSVTAVPCNEARLCGLLKETPTTHIPLMIFSKS
jgi:hypothetical protein